MKTTPYRRLRRDELEDVRDQFVKFLGVNGIDAATWQRLKVEEPTTADGLILQFSQLVFDGTLKRVEYLVQRRPNDLRTYKCGPDKIEMRGVLVSGETSLDLTDTETSPQDMLITLRSEGAQLRLYSAERSYQEVGREQDIYRIMEQEGALIDPSEFFETLAQLG